MKINNDLIQTGELIWTNPNPSVSMANTTITVNKDLSNFDMFTVIANESNTLARRSVTPTVPAGMLRLITARGGNMHWRDITIPSSGTSVTIGTGNMSGQTSNDSLIPMYIIGHKTNLF